MNVMLQKSILNKLSGRTIHQTSRPFSVAYNVKSKFEQAYAEKKEAMSKVKQEV